MQLDENITPLKTELIYRKFTTVDFEFEDGNSAFDVDDIDIPADSEGYVSKQLIEFLIDESELKSKNSTVINAGVGQGKTTAVHKVAERHIEEGYIVIIATPFRSIVEKYSKFFTQEVKMPEDRITTMESFDKETSDEFFSGEETFLYDNQLHIVTVNLLLGNPGNDAHLQSSVKSQYLSSLIGKCKSQGKKIVIFFDEIHAGINSFQYKYIFNLFKFKDILHKLFYVSATFSESSLLVIQNLAILTNDKIKLINCERFRNEELRAKLNLIITPENYSSKNTKALREELNPIITKAVNNKQKLSVLSYSKKLAESLCYDSYEKDSFFNEIFKELNVYDKVNCCVNVDDNSYKENNHYEKDKINIGTNFKTGIDIEDGIYIILMPSSASLNKNFVSDGNFGVFTNGANSIIQAIARMRGKGEIYIIMGTPNELIDFDYHQFESEILEGFKLNESNFGKAQNINNKTIQLRSFYNFQRNYLNEQIEEFENHDNSNFRPILRYPSFEEYVLERGEKYFYNQYLYYGHRVSPFIIWAALNDQFQNCTLNAIKQISPVIEFTRGNEKGELEEFINESYSEDYYGYNTFTLDTTFFQNSDKYIIQDIKTRLAKYSIRYHGVDKRVFPRELVKLIIDFVAKAKKGIDYNKFMYLNDCVSFSKNVNEEDETELIKLYKQLHQQKKRFFDLFQQREFMFSTYNSMPETEKELFNRFFDEIMPLLNRIKESDSLASREMFDLFSRTLTYTSLYTLFINSFLEFEKFDVNRRSGFYGLEGNKPVKKLLGLKHDSTRTTGLNFFYDYKENFEGYESEGFTEIFKLF
ncbi:DEAD/DEAH box helicase family protein [Winogradskyella luteola]|uniref:DEAD/DEAH box helicase family protein n=1 Tax=Winogradskyella luteola TaxID=2828330 RepID=A0A9X1JN37_9FLAO|nr:DEAD/DEAH box helicase family protein [Winogradskyella luteola]MBV7268946.1 DEAD/DEAH box helicase family protein [Winogradskyella luteola]